MSLAAPTCELWPEGCEKTESFCETMQSKDSTQSVFDLRFIHEEDLHPTIHPRTGLVDHAAQELCSDSLSV